MQRSGLDNRRLLTEKLENETAKNLLSAIGDSVDPVEISQIVRNAAMQRLEQIDQELARAHTDVA